MRKSSCVAGALALSFAVSLSFSGCRKAPAPAPERPTLTLRLKAVTPGGEPLAGVAVEARAQVRGETNADGEMSFTFTADPGDEWVVTAKLDRPGMQFEPWQQALVVRKWDAAKPETLTYDVEATMRPRALATRIEIETAGAPAEAADVRVDGKLLQRAQDGSLSVDLGTSLTRSAKLAVKLKGFEPFEETATLHAGETYVARLAKIGVQYGKVVVAYEAMERANPVVGADVTLGGKEIGRTDKAGSLRYEVPEKATQMDVRAEGFIPTPATATVPGRRPTQVNVLLVPREPPVYRLALLTAKSPAASETEVDSSLAEIEDKLADQLFSHPCFVRADNEKAADAIVTTTASRADGALLVSVKVSWAKGKPIAGFAEMGKPERIKALTENVAEKVLDVFPFEGHVLGFDGERAITSLGNGKDRGVKKGNTVALYHWDGSAKPPKTTALGRAVVRQVDGEFSRVELQKGAQKPEIGDKVVLLPRALEASFDSALALTIKAGRAGSERPFSDVSVYRDGVWVGTTSASGEIRVPVASSDKHVFLFVRGGVKPYREEIAVAQAGVQKTIVLPDVTSRLKLESEPSGARVRVDDEEMGTTPLETDVLMGFHRLTVDAGGDWRAYEKVIEFAGTETNMTGSRRIVLQKDALRRSEALLEKGDVSGAISVLAQVAPGHPDYSAAHHRLAGIYLDQKKDPAHAISEFQKVLELPENRELVNKRFAVTFLNLGRAYYMLGTAEGYRKAIEQLLIARDNKRFFPKDQHDRAVHDTHYFLALASHKLYHAGGGERVLQETQARWKDYFDYYPASLEGADELKQARTSAEQYYEEVKRKLKDTE